MEKIIAHKKDENIQELSNHLLNVSKISSNIGKKIGIENIMILVSMLHDLGKADRNFQNYISNVTKKKVNHSSAGGKYLFECVTKIIKENTSISNNTIIYKYFLEILEYVIFSHHGLYDVISEEGESNTERRRNYNNISNERYYYEEDVKEYIKFLENEKNIEFKKYIEKAFEEFKIFFDKIDNMIKNEKTKINKGNDNLKKVEDEKRCFYCHCFMRLVLSILKEGDISDTINVFLKEPFVPIEEKKIYELWNNIEENIELKYKKFEKISENTPINILRKKLSETAKIRGEKDSVGIYKLELPTGSGKTLTSFRYAIEQAKNLKKDRIIYVTAFLSVLEQNAEEIKKIINNEEYILEHHSNIIEDENDSVEEETANKNSEEYEEISKKQYLINSWDSPVILTTMVQFFNTLFKEKASNIRRFSKLVNSVIIIDEVQSIPKKAIYLSNLIMNFMKEFMNCTIIHCSATQPSFDGKVLTHKILYGDIEGKNSDIVSMKENEKKIFERVNVYNYAGKNGNKIMGTKELSNFILSMYDEDNSILIILNTKKSVKIIYDELKNSSKVIMEDLYYLSTNMCAAHRLEKIKEMKDKLSKNKKVICVSTQLIEAGVDVDFNIVLRSVAGIDSIIQSIGRCNREGKLEKGKFYIINHSEEDLKYLKDIERTVEATSGILEEEVSNINNLKEPYYNRYYVNNLEEMRYKLENENDLLSMLSINKKSRSDYKKLNGKNYNWEVAQSFKNAAVNFNLIEKDTTSIIVNYDEKSNELISELKIAIREYKILQIKKLLKKLQRYAVNIYNKKKFYRFIEEYKEYGISILLDGYYGETGIEIEELATLII